MNTDNLRSKAFDIEHEKKTYPFVSNYNQSPPAPLQARKKDDHARDFPVICSSQNQEEDPADCPVQDSVLECFLFLRKTNSNVL